MATYAAQDLTYLKSLEAERIALTGTTIRYWPVRLGQNVDPLYNEPTAFSFATYADFTGHFEFVESDARSPSVRDEGLESETDAEIYFAKSTWDTAFPTSSPKEGDVIRVNSLYFDVVNVGAGGPVMETASFVGYKAMIKRRSKYLPDRKGPS